MKDSECVEFLQWALPRLGFRWPGFRKVRRQVCKRIDRRIGELELEGPRAYREYLEHQAVEWEVLDQFCRISISRFYRDRAVFDFVCGKVLPELAADVTENGEAVLRCWSAGCASGEEPYTVNLIWRFLLQSKFSHLDLSITATDSDPYMLERARHAQYPSSSLKDLPPEWISRAFEQVGQGSDAVYRLRIEHRESVEWVCQDLRDGMPDGPFHLILCRHLAFTYFDVQQQQRMIDQILARLTPGGFLVTGKQEKIEADTRSLQKLAAPVGIYQKLDE